MASCKDICKNCNKNIEVTIFRGSGVCSVDCRKALGLDVSSVGTMMFVTTEEKHTVEEARRGGF